MRYIGKEANRWEEQCYLGLDPEAQIEYGIDEDSGEQFRAQLRQAVKFHGERNLARTARVAREQLRAVRKGEAKPRPKTIAKLLRAISLLAAKTPGEPITNARTAG